MGEGCLWEGRLLLLGLVALVLRALTVRTLLPFGFTYPPPSLLTPDKSGCWSALRAQRNYLAAQHQAQLKACACPFSPILTILGNLVREIQELRLT